MLDILPVPNFTDTDKKCRYICLTYMPSLDFSLNISSFQVSIKSLVKVSNHSHEKLFAFLNSSMKFFYFAGRSLTPMGCLPHGG